MAMNFIGCDREQVFLMPPSLREWVPDDHLVWTVLDAVAEMDLGAFYATYRVDGHGRPAYEPSMMVALLRGAGGDAIASRGVDVFERTPVTEVAREGSTSVLRTPKGRVRAARSFSPPTLGPITSVSSSPSRFPCDVQQRGDLRAAEERPRRHLPRAGGDPLHSRVGRACLSAARPVPGSRLRRRKDHIHVLGCVGTACLSATYTDRPSAIWCSSEIPT
jgi:hypothetical protein